MTTPAARASRTASLRRGVALAPQLRAGLEGTVALALLATAGRVVVPVAVQQVLDRGLRGGHVHPHVVQLFVGVAVLAVAGTAVASYLVNARLFTATEGGLAQLRTLTFRHVHDLSMLHQQQERRGSLVSRVTSDVDTISLFMQYGGVFVLTASGQLLLATAVMLVYSPPLALLVLACFVPLALVVHRLQRRLGAAYGLVRQRVGEMLGAIAESIVGAPVIRAYAVSERTAERIDTAIGAYRGAQVRAQTLSASTYSLGEVAASVATAGVVVLGTVLGVGGHLSVGRLVAFLFLVSLFVQPVQVATEALNEAQNALAAFHRVIEVLDTPSDVTDPGPAGTALPAGGLDIRFRAVRFGYPTGPEVLHGIDLQLPAHARVAIVGETGSGKTTMAKLLTRLMDPSSGVVELGGVALPRVPFADLRRRVVLVPQDGFLFDDTVAGNVRQGRPGITDSEVAAALGELGLADWLAMLPAGIATRVGQRGEELSVGERQLVAIARAYVADPDLLVLDEATSAVDPATERRLQAALDSLTRGRTAVTIAHRLSTAEHADVVVVMDAGQVVAVGPHAQLVADSGSVYARLHESWARQQRVFA